MSAYHTMKDERDVLEDRVSQLERENRKLKAENADLLAALKAMLSHPHNQPRNDALHRDLKAARAAIAEVM